MNRFRVPKVKLVREGWIGTEEPPLMRSPRDVFQLLRQELGQEEVEVFGVLLLTARASFKQWVQVSRGTLNGSLVTPREVFRIAVCEGAAGIILVHNHPSGDPTPSADDRSVTHQLVAAGRVLDVGVHDHVIIGDDRYVSFAEAGLLT